MRIEGPKGQSAKLGKRVSGAAGGFSLPAASSTDQAATPAAPTGTAPVTHLDALLSLQAVDGAGDRRRRAVQKGHDMLDQLEALRADLLGGKVGPQRIHALMGLLRANMDADDPKLAALIDDIALRARVELAKLGHELP